MTASMFRTAFIALLLLVPAAAVAAPRSATPPAHRALRTPQLSVEPTAVPAGEAVTLQGTDFPRNVRVTLLAGPPHAEATRIGSATTGRRGRFTATIRTRPHSTAGTFVALACHDACRVKASVRFRILAP